MPVDKRMVVWTSVGAGFGAVLRSLVTPAWTGMSGLVAVAVMTIAGGLLAGVALGLQRGAGTALLLGFAGGAASAGLYAVVGVTAGLRTGAVFLIAVPLLTALALAVGMSAVGIVRHRDRTKVAR